MAKTELMVKTVQREKNGDPGKDGTNGKDGVDGQDGYTPQKGTDYFTQSEIEEIENDILEKVDVPQQIFYWNGKKNEAGLNTLTQLYELNQKSDIIFMWDVYNLTTGAQCITYLKKETLKINSQNSTIYGYFYNEGSSNGNLSYHSYYIKQGLTFTYQDGKVTNVTAITSSQRHYLDTNTDYSTPYTPKYDGSPATKKYVDDSIANAITDAIGGVY